MSAAAKLPGRLGHYRVRGRVRFDHCAEILIAREEGPLGFERDVTLRAVTRDPTAQTWGELELAREARITERLDHPAIARVLELFTDGDRLVLAVEGAQTITLEALLARGEPLSDDACGYVLATVASALAHAHERSVIHRALDPEAVVITADGTARLTSFGVARMLESTADSAVTLLNTRAQMPSPEEASGAPPSAKTDVWALGVLSNRLFAERADLPREARAAIDAALAGAISCAEFAKWIDRVFDVDAGKQDLGALVELEFDATPELSSAPRLSRTIRRQEASRRRLRRAREREDEIEIEPVEIEPIEIEPVAVIEPPPPPVPRAAMPALTRVVSIRPPLAAVAPDVQVTARSHARPPLLAIAPRRRSFAWVPARLLFAAAVVGALFVTAHRIRKLPLVAAATAAQQPEPKFVLAGNACVESDPHCAIVPKPPPVITPPARKLPEQFGWVHVHSNGTVGRVFVAARAWGEPEKTIAVPCGRFYVNVARTNSKGGGWYGWLNIGETVNVACDGTVTEVTLKAVNASYEVRTPRPKTVSKAKP